MRINTLITKIDKSKLTKLNYFDHRIIYQDKSTKQLKVAIPDYNNLIIDDTNLEEALSSDKVMVVQRQDPFHPQSVKPLIILTTNDGIVEGVNSNEYNMDDLVHDLTMDGKSLVKILK